MPAGISKAKGRRNTKSKRRAGFQAHPPKAGKRKTYGPVKRNADGVIVSGVRKTKSIGPVTRVNADGKELSPYIQSDTRFDSGVVFKDKWKSGDAVMVARRK